MLHRILPALLVALLSFACEAQTTDGVPAVGAGPAQPEKTGAADDGVAAELGDAQITLSELDAYIKDQLFARETRKPGQLFDLRTQYLQRLVDERILDRLAAESGSTPEEILVSELAKMPAISDEEVASFYEENKAKMADKSLEEMTPQIREFLDRDRAPEAMANLRERAGARVLLEPPRVEVAPIGPALGPETAPVTIVEFSDFQCPFCQRAIPVIAELRERYPERVRIVYRHLPLDRIHPRARAAAEASLCADDQGEFWAYHDTLFENRRALADEDLERYATELGLDGDVFAKCLADGTHKDAVERDAADARAIGITGTPAFFVNGILVSGAKPVDHFVGLIDRELGRNGASPAEGG